MSAPLSAAATIDFTVNGQARRVEAGEDISLLDVLRDQLGLISPKNGCAPQGHCGCCTVLLDGKAVVACVIPAAKCAGKTVVTLEGFGARDRDILGDAYAASGGLQCGFCIPGFVVRTKHLLDKTPNPTDEEIARGLGAHLCRCTGYVKIFDAVKLAAAAFRGEPVAAPACDGRIGSRLPKFEAKALALGDRPYIDDMTLPGLLHGAVLLSAHPRALVRAVRTEKARALPGVRAVLTARDVPGSRWQGLIYKDWPVFVAEGEETRYVGDVLAAVAAETRRAARQALAAIEVDYQVLPPVTSPEAALAPGAPKVHEKGNLLSKSVNKRGDADAALAASAHVVRRTWQTQTIEHAFLEPESSLAVPEGGGLHCYSQGQGVYDDQRQLASLTGLPLDQVRVTLVSNGGAFGGKEDLSIQGHTALLARATGRPVKITLTRDESMRLHPKRHPIKMEYAVGCDRDGRLTAVRARMIGDKGAYASVGSKVLERACGHATGPYKVANVDVEALAVYTNNPPNGAMRGFGANQAAFAIEGALDILAEQVGIDGWEMRYRNILRDGDRFGTGQIMEHCAGIERSLLAVKDAYRGAKYAGIAMGIKNCGIGNGMPETGRACMVVERDGTVMIHNGFTEMGQGLFTIMIQTAVEETGLPAATFKATADTERKVECGMTTASRGTILAGVATREAAKKLRADLDAGHPLQDLVGREYRGEVIYRVTTSLDAKTDDPKTHFTFGYAAQVVILNDQGKIEKVVAAHDVGKALNPLLVEGQIEGSVHMGLGYALTEEMRYEGGVPVTTKIGHIGVLRPPAMPKVEVILIEEPEPLGPYGARGVGEIGLVPTAPAVAEALRKFDGKRRFVLPMKDAPAARP